jgi:hypothetical protein
MLSNYTLPVHCFTACDDKKETKHENIKMIQSVNLMEVLSDLKKASFKQGIPAGEGTTSTEKTTATAGSVWKTKKKVAGNEVRNMAVNVQ